MYISPHGHERFNEAQRNAKTAWTKILISIPVGVTAGIGISLEMAKGQNYTWAQEAKSIVEFAAFTGMLAALGSATLVFLDRFAKRTQRIRPDGSFRQSPLVALLTVGALFLWGIVLCIIFLVLLQYHIV